jgi:hypothetical protein
MAIHIIYCAIMFTTPLFLYIHTIKAIPIDSCGTSRRGSHVLPITISPQHSPENYYLVS